MQTSSAQGTPDVIIVGAGLAGLNCARYLERQGISCQIIEASNAVGGRIRTDQVEGFRLDRGFQILLTSYPETKSTLSFERLDLKPLVSGALIQSGDRRYRVVHPLIHPGGVVSTAFFPHATLRDKLRAAWLGFRTFKRPVARIFSARGGAPGQWTSTDSFLAEAGFTSDFIESFLRPFFAGVFLENELRTASQFFEFMYRMFGTGHATVPAQGMQAIPEQLARDLEATPILFDQPVQALFERGVRLRSGQVISARQVVLACELPAAKKILGLPLDREDSKPSCTLYFAAPHAPVDEPIIVLNGDSHGVVNNFNVLTLTAPMYAPPGMHLISANVVGLPIADETLLHSEVLKQARRWFGAQVDQWEHLRTYFIPHSLPTYSREHSGLGLNRDCPEWLDLCGDYLETPSIEGALRSGRRTAEEVVRKINAASYGKAA